MKIRRVVTALALTAAACLLAACNTMEGLGKDVEKGGEALQRAAD